MVRMKLQVHPEQLQTLAAHLAKAGDREIGGVLVGEHMSENVFRLVDLSFQVSPGTDSCFVRRPDEHERFFADFFERTGRDFERFNYMGEWHSHPSFAAWPSRVDHAQMQAIVEDGAHAPLFSVLVVARLAGRTEIQLSATAYRAHARATPVDVELVSRTVDDSMRSQPPWWRRILARAPKDIRLTCIGGEHEAPERK